MKYDTILLDFDDTIKKLNGEEPQFVVNKK